MSLEISFSRYSSLTKGAQELWLLSAVVAFVVPESRLVRVFFSAMTRVFLSRGWEQIMFQIFILNTDRGFILLLCISSVKHKRLSLSLKIYKKNIYWPVLTLKIFIYLSKLFCCTQCLHWDIKTNSYNSCSRK